MKILHNADHWLPQTQSWMYTQLKYLPEGFDAQVACLSTENLDQFGDVDKIHCLQEGCSQVGYFVRRVLRKARLRRGLGWLKEPLHEFKPDLVHSHFGHVGWTVLPELRNGTPHVVTFYGFDLSKLPRVDPRWRTRYKELFADVVGVLCEGEHMASSIEALGCDPVKIYVQRLGILTDKIVFRPRAWDGQEPLRILLAGTFTEKKGFPYALNGLARLARDLPVDITIIGDARAFEADQTEKQKMIQVIKDGGLEDKVTFLGYQPLAVLLEQAYKHHIFLSPSVTAETGDTEGGAPVTIIEMAATGMPVISTNHCDIPGVLNYGRQGMLAPERDVEALVDILHGWLSVKEDWPELTLHARKHIDANFDAAKQGQKLGAIYEKLVNG